LRPDSGGPQSFKDGQLTAQITTIDAGKPAVWLVGCIANIVAGIVGAFAGYLFRTLAGSGHSHRHGDLVRGQRIWPNQTLQRGYPPRMPL